MKDDSIASINEYARLYVRGTAKEKGRIRYLACDPAYTDGNWTWTTDIAEANLFGLGRLPELLEWVRGKSGGYAVKLRTVEGTCTLAERAREARRDAPSR